MERFKVVHISQLDRKVESSFHKEIPDEFTVRTTQQMNPVGESIKHA